MTKAERIAAEYDNGRFMVLINHRGMTVYRNRDHVRVVNNRIEVRSGKRWISALGCQVRFASKS